MTSARPAGNEPAARPLTVGTAGHIDHGKSALVRALTGIDPDRLAEERRRGMTLDLGFAHLDLPSGRRVGIVDVPGHEALVHNMLAGAGGVDLVLLVVAADEGPMPQTREHVDILRFLPLRGGLVVLTKADLVEDPEWFGVVEEEVAALVRGTVLEGAPVLRVSARTGRGLDALVAALDRLAAGVPPRPADGPVRLPVDRSFTIQGFGTVVTGTLWSGRILPGQTLVVQPHGREVRVRGVEMHGRSVPEGLAGGRVAVNLAGIEKDEVRRGDVLASPGVFLPTDRLDVRLRLLDHAPALRSGSRVHVHLGAGATVGRVVSLEGRTLGPGDEAVARLRLEAPVVAVHGDRFVIRRYSPTRTIGGGTVLDAAPRPDRPRAADTAERGPTDLVVAAAVARGPAGLGLAEVGPAAGLDTSAAADAVRTALASGALQVVADRLVARTVVEGLRDGLVAAVEAFHRQAPWRGGIPREELKSRLVGPGADRVFDMVLAGLVHEGRLVERRGLVSRTGTAPRLSPQEAAVRTVVLEALHRGGASPPPLSELQRLGPIEAVDRALQSLMDEGLVLAVGPDLRYAVAALEEVRALVVEMARSGHEVTVATLRDRLQTSRRYALALLEYLDGLRVTRRVGDRRVLGPQADVPLADAAPRSR